MTKRNAGFLQLPLLLILGAFIAGGGYFAYTKTQELKVIENKQAIVPSVESEPVGQATVEIASTTTSPVPKKVTEVVKVVAKAVPSTALATTTPKIIPPAHTVEEIVKKWGPYVVPVRCIGYNQTGQEDHIGSGIVYEELGAVKVMTARHLFGSGASTSYCTVTFYKKYPQPNEVYRIENSERSLGPKVDIGFLTIKQSGSVGPSSEVKELANANKFKVCPTRTVVSDTGIILGHPSTDLKSSSARVLYYRTGADESYYGSYAIGTSVGNGYSGGIVVSLEDDCALGVLSSADDEKNESYAVDLNYYQQKLRELTKTNNVQ